MTALATIEMGAGDAMLTNQAAAIDALAFQELVDAPTEASFDRVTRVASAILQTPIALISLVDRHRLWLKSCLGLSVRATPHEVSFCSHTIQGGQPFIVPDTLEDPRFAHDPLVLADPGIRFYLGIPLRMQNGQTLGTLCTLDTTPRAPTAAQVEILSDLATMVVDEIELRQMVMTDSLTGALARRGLEARLQSEMERCQRYHRTMSVLAFDLDHFKRINDAHGHAAGDLLLRSVVIACQESLRTTDVVGRTGGEEFLALLPETAGPEAMLVAERLRATIAGLSVRYGHEMLSITASFGVTTLDDRDRAAIHPIRRADAALYAAKGLGRNRVVQADLDA